MKILRIFLALAASFMFLHFSTFAQTPKEAICVVCQLTEGATKPEKVAAKSEYQGTAYYFCAQKCKEEFDADPAAYLPPVLPRPAPNFMLPNLAGEKIALESYRGKVVLLDFWATWCKPCVKSMPALQTLHGQFASRGFTVLGISTDEEKKKIKPFIEKHKIVYPILVDSENDPAWEGYKVKIIPMMFLVNQSGEIVQQWAGATNLKEVESAVASLLGKND
jgi:peroxiredoxin/YHS domain-containing protein